jgi:two-component system nitrate/nitrite response regulator NarL
MMETKNALIVNRDAIFCVGIRYLLEDTPFEVLSDVRQPADAATAIEAGLQVDLILSEIYEDFADFTELLRKVEPSPKVVILAPPHKPLPADFPLDEIHGLLGQHIAPAALVRALELVVSSEHVYPIDRGFLTLLKDRTGPRIRLPRELEDLSQREIEILRCLAMGYPNKTIARQLDIAETTVKAHVKAILRKTKAGNRTQAATWSMSHGISGPTLPFNGASEATGGGAGGQALEGSQPTAIEAARTSGSLNLQPVGPTPLRVLHVSARRH